MPWRENGVFSQEVCFDKLKVKGKYEYILIKSMFHHFYKSMTVQIKKNIFFLYMTRLTFWSDNLHSSNSCIIKLVFR